MALYITIVSTRLVADRAYSVVIIHVAKNCVKLHLYKF